MSSRKILLTAAVASMLIGLAAVATASPYHSASPPSMSFHLTYQGRLADASGNPVANQTLNAIFRIYEQASGGAAIWTQPRTISTDASGLFHTVLSIDPPLREGGVEAINNLWLGIQVASDPEMVPRQQLTGAPYAFTLVPGAGITGTVAHTQSPYAMLVVNNMGTGAGFVSRSEKGVGAAFTSEENHAVVIGGSALVESPNLRQIALNRWYDVNEAGIRYNVGSDPKGAVFDGMSLWVTESISNTVSRWRVADGAFLGRYPVGQYPVGAAFDGARLWVACRGDNTVHVLRMSDGTPIRTVAVGHQPNDIAFDGEHLWVTNDGNNTVSKVRAATYAVIGDYSVGQSPRIVIFDGLHVWVSNFGDNTVTVLNPENGATVATHAVGQQPVGLSYDGACVWVANSGSNTVSRLRASDGALLGTYAVGMGPRGLAFDGGHIWATNFEEDTVTKLRARDGEVVGTYPVGDGPRGVAFDGCNIWVVNGNEASLNEL
jgi:YVTN family beta-propeller protein